ncbi:hypothetical protein HY798_01165 [Candidatus Falkowbacteria bacterium]|nr:hypothetical protein [Candidatus Falkowbacteria bacterium]
MTKAIFFHILPYSLQILARFFKKRQYQSIAKALAGRQGRNDDIAFAELKKERSASIIQIAPIILSGLTRLLSF